MSAAGVTQEEVNIVYVPNGWAVPCWGHARYGCRLQSLIRSRVLSSLHVWSQLAAPYPLTHYLTQPTTNDVPRPSPPPPFL